MTATHEIWDAVRATWPAIHTRPHGPFLWQEGGQGGKRVNAARQLSTVSRNDLRNIETRFIAENRAPLFQLHPHQSDFDALLSDEGYTSVDTTLCLHAPLETLLSFEHHQPNAHWPITTEQTKIWKEGGVGDARLAIMERVSCPKTALFCNQSATAFVGVHKGIAALHSLEVAQTARRQGHAFNLMLQAANWAQMHSAHSITVLVTRDNAPARALYCKLGMSEIGRYHYRHKEDF